MQVLLGYQAKPILPEPILGKAFLGLVGAAILSEIVDGQTEAKG